jgi:hypothetical protein
MALFGMTSLASAQALAQGAACPSGEAAHVAIVVDESASIDSTEAVEIRAGLQDFVDDELDSGLVISFIGMSDADTDERNDHILAQPVTSSTKSAFDGWITGYRDRVIPGGQSGTGGEDFWASGLEEATELTTVPRIVFIVTDGSSGSKSLTTSYVADLESRGSHVFVYGISTGDYWDQGAGTPLGPSLAGVLAANPVEASAPDGSDLLTTDYDARATFVSLGDALSALSTSLRNSGVRIPETDSDCVLDSEDPDSDSDGILDIDESPGFTTDPDGDADGDTILDYLDPDTVACTDADGDGECEAPPAILDPDGDGIPNHRDLDSDGDGIPDANEAQPSFSYRQARGEDLDEDGLDDAFDTMCDATPTMVAGNGALVESSNGAFNANNVLGAPDGSTARINQTNEFILVLLEDEVAVGQTITINATANRNPELSIGQSIDGQNFSNIQTYTNLNAAPELYVVTGEPARYIALELTQDDNGLITDGYIDIDALSYSYMIDSCAGFVAGTPVSPVDTDGDGTPDFLDTDSNDNGVLDANESGLTLAGVDANGDGIDDAINASYADPDGDIDDTGADLLNTDGFGELDFREFDSDGDGVPDDEDTDDDGDGIPDTVEAATAANGGDTDGDGIPDERDLDSDNDGINDVDEAGYDDLDRDGFADGDDGDNDGRVDNLPAMISDLDNDGTPDFQEVDADNDGTFDIASTPLAAADANNDGRVDDLADGDRDGIVGLADELPSLFGDDGDPDGDGVNTSIERAVGTDPLVADSDGDGLCDGLVAVANVCIAGEDAAGGQNSDGDGLIDALDDDDDGDGILTADEVTDSAAINDNDVDGADGPNWADTDADGDGVLDGVEGRDDRNNNGIPAYLDPSESLDPAGDADGDTLLNGDEYAIGTNPNMADSDGDGVRDDVEVQDLNNPRNSDMDMFIDALDPDDDNDGVATLDEDVDGDGDPTDDDSDQDGTPDYLDADDDNDGVLTANEDIDASGDPSNDDTDNDGTPDYLDDDDDGDGVLTSNEPGDADASGTPDRLEPCTPDAQSLACPTGDPDGDGTPNDTDPDPNDPCVPDANALACDTGDGDGDGLTNGAERMLGTDPNSADSDGDGLCDGSVAVANVCAAGENAGAGQDSDSDGTIDALDLDDDGDGVNSALEDVGGDGNPANDDTDNDGTPDYLDNDDDGDGVLTSNEPGDADGSGVPDRLEPCTPDADALACPSGDPDGDGTPNDTDPDPNDPCVPDTNALACDTGDTDGDGIDNGTERAVGTDPGNLDSDGDGLCDGVVAVANACVGGEDAAGGQDSDGDGDIDALDEDDDGDGIDTADEDIDANGDPTDDDSDQDGTPDYLDADDDNDGVDTADEDRNNNNDPTDDDSDSDGTPNYLDTDDDGDGVNTSDEDVNMNGDLFDDDTNGDGTPDFLDPCDPDPSATACSMGDTDGDGEPNDTDPDPGDPCNPNPNALACPSGDTDMDGLTNLDEAMIGSNPASADSDGDGVPDGLEVPDVANPLDTDMDGTIDALDEDDDDDGKLTADEDIDNDGDYFDDDSDGDGIPDFLDGDDTDGPDGDVDGDGVRNADEDRNMDGDYGNDDADGDGIPDFQDADDDGDGILTRNEDRDMDGDPLNDDTDRDGTPDYLDKDDDGDGVSTLNEDVNGNGDPRDDDTNMNGVPDYLDPCDPDDMSVACLMGDTDGDEVANNVDPDPLDPCNPNPDALACPTGDTDMDGVSNGVERTIGTDPTSGDSDGDGVSDGVEIGADVANPLDTDNDGIIDALDDDDDGDGVLTVFEDLDGDGDPVNDDTDMDGTPDYLDADDDGDGIDTSAEQADPNGDGDPADAVDTDMDNVPDYLDPEEGMGTELVISSPADGDTVSVIVTVSGTGEPGEEVEIFIDGESVGTATVDEQGNWTRDVAADPGTREITATSGGQTAGPVTVTVEEVMTPAQVTITSPSEGDTLTEGPNEISGTGEPGEEVEVFVDGESVGTATVDEQGNWSIGVDLPAGNVTVQATQGMDSVTVSVSVEPDGGQDAIAVTISSPSEGEVLETANPTLRGTATSGADVELAIDGQLVGMVTANGQGSWAYELVEPLDAGEHTLAATATLDEAEATAMVTFSVSEDAVRSSNLILTGGSCAQAPGDGAPGGQGWLLALLLGGVFARRVRRR